MTSTELKAKVRYVLQDAAGVRWSDAELCDWAIAGVREIATSAPRSSTVTKTIATVGGTRQEIDGIVLMDVVRNMKVDGAVETPGTPIREIPVQSLDAMIPGWHTDRRSTQAIYFVRDSRLPKVFYLYPPRPTVNPGSVSVVMSEMIDTSAMITVNGVLGNFTVPLPEQYGNALVDYVCFRCFSDNAAVPNAIERAKYHLAAFQASLASAEGIGAPAPPQPVVQQAAQ